MKTVNVSGKKCMLNLDKKGKTGTLMIPLKNHMLIGLTLNPATRASELTSLAQQIPLSRLEYNR